MPAPLWEAAVALARTHGLYPIARALRLDYGSLKKRLASPPQGKLGGDTSGFVEIHPAPWLGQAEPGGVSVELRAVDGTKLIIQLPDNERLDLPALIEAFQRRRA